METGVLLGYGGKMDRVHSRCCGWKGMTSPSSYSTDAVDMCVTDDVVSVVIADGWKAVAVNVGSITKQ